jgi:hypothetical protein
MQYYNSLPVHYTHRSASHWRPIVSSSSFLDSPTYKEGEEEEEEEELAEVFPPLVATLLDEEEEEEEEGFARPMKMRALM